MAEAVVETAKADLHKVGRMQAVGMLYSVLTSLLGTECRDLVQGTQELKRCSQLRR